jgi:UDP-N-acetylmuramate--alanine ligase
MTDEVLKRSGIEVIEYFSADNIPADADLIVYSTAYNAERNPEVAKALAGKVKTLAFAQALGEAFNQKYGIAVIGSHGKTTTTAWLGYVMNASGLKPNVMVGANVPQFAGASLIGASDYLVIEADEYQNKLQYFQPKAVLLNNIDWDHPDFFPDRDAYRQVFVEFIKKIPSKGFLVCNYDDAEVRKIARVNSRGKIITYAINESADYVAYDIKLSDGNQFFKVKFGVTDEIDDDEDPAQSELGDFSIRLTGKHNIYNALAVIAASVELGIDLVKIRTSLSEFAGTTRRMQKMGDFRGAVIIDDYAHHPTEVKTTLEAIRKNYPERRLITVFHPHTYTRTKALLDKFSTSFNDADLLIVLDIYGSAREKQGGVHTQDMINKIIEIGELKTKPIYIPGLAEAEKYLRDIIERGDIVVLMGAGDVFRIGENLIKTDD